MARLPIRMPKMSMTMTEGEVSEWMVSVGDTITDGDVVVEVMTDKIDMEVESTVSGVLVEIVVESGIAPVGEPIGWVEGEDDGGDFGDLLSEPRQPAASAVDVPEEVPAAEVPAAQVPAEYSASAEPETTREPAPPTTSPPPSAAGLATASGPVAAVPRARALARESGVDLSGVSGTGPDGLVLVGDVEAALGTAAPAAPAPPATAPAQPTPPTPPTRRAAPESTAAPTPAAPDPRKAAIRAAVARKMTPSATIPQFTVWRDLDLESADARRRGASWTTMLVRAYAAALRDVPDLLARWQDDRAVDSGPPAIALAVATDRGLLVPTLLEPDLRSPEDLDAEIRDVVRAAHTGKLSRDYLVASNGSLSNLGGLGVDRFQALLTPPQASVLSLGSIRKRPVAVPGGVGLALTVEAGLTVDHRVADGAHGARLLAALDRHLNGTR